MCGWRDKYPCLTGYMNFKGASELLFFTALSTVHPWGWKTRHDEPKVWSAVTDPSLLWEKQTLHYEITSSLIAWDLSPAVVNRNWFTSLTASSASKTWFKFAIVDHFRRDLIVSWLFAHPWLKVTQQRTSAESPYTSFSPEDFYFKISYSGKFPWCWGL